MLSTLYQVNSICDSHTDNSNVVLRSLELPEGDIDGDTTLALGLQFVEDPCVLEGTLAQLGGFLFDVVSVGCCGELSDKEFFSRPPRNAPP